MADFWIRRVRLCRAQEDAVQSRVAVAACDLPKAFTVKMPPCPLAGNTGRVPVLFRGIIKELEH